MSPSRAKLPSRTAALAGVPAGVQATGPWTGRRQLFVKFAGEAETATIYTADALKGELLRLTARSKYYAVAVAGRDPLAEEEFLRAAFDGGAPLPVMLDHDGQRPEALAGLLGALALVQVTIDGCEGEAALERVYASLRLAAEKQVNHALAIVPADAASDPLLQRIVEEVHAASAETAVVVHPTVESASGQDRRWVLWLEKVAATHADVRILPRLPVPTGMR
jgi:hypothetical protein